MTRHSFDRARLCAAVLAASTFAFACSREPRGPAEAIRLVAASPGKPAATYTLGDETRPVLALPPEIRLQPTIPSGLQGRFGFPVTDPRARGELIATGVYERQGRVYPLEPTVVAVSPDAAGTMTATMEVPPIARGPGPESRLTLVLLRPPERAVVETASAPITVPRGARLHFAYGLTEAAALRGAAPVALEVVARETAGSTDAGAAAPASGPERPLWSTVWHLEFAQLARWHDVTVDLADLAGRRVTLVFRAKAAGEGRPVLAPVWGDPTITAPAPRPASRRNVVLISIDTLRADHVGTYGAARPTTPAIDALAAQSVVFEHAWSVWPETSGSHMSLFTSRFPSEHGVTSFITAPAPSLELLAERLRHAGYLTRAYTEDGGVWALAGFARGFSAYAERRSPDFVYRGDAEATFADAAKWIEANADRTFFLFVHTYQVHAPYTPPPAYRTLFADVPGREPKAMAPQALAYDQEARFTDDQVARFLATMRRLGLAERIDRRRDVRPRRGVRRARRQRTRPHAAPGGADRCR